MEPVADTQIAIGITSTLVYEGAMNASLQEFILTNVSAGGQRISFSFSDTQPAVDGYGPVIYPGGFVGDSSTANHHVYSGRIYAIADLAGALLAVHIR